MTWGVLSIVGGLLVSIGGQCPSSCSVLGLAIASYRWIETPLREGNWFGKRWMTLVVGGGVLVSLSGVWSLSANH